MRNIPKNSIKVSDKKSDAVAYIYTNVRGEPAAKIYYGRQSKPVAHHYFRTEALRSACIVKMFNARQMRAEYMATRRAERAANVRRIQVGAVFYTSWGYDQTNIDWYQVTALVGKNSLKVREIGKIDASKPGMAWATGKSIPDVDNFIGPEQLVRANGDSFRVDRQYAHMWDGKPKNWTAYA